MCEHLVIPTPQAAFPGGSGTLAVPLEGQAVTLINVPSPTWLSCLREWFGQEGRALHCPVALHGSGGESGVRAFVTQG